MLLPPAAKFFTLAEIGCPKPDPDIWMLMGYYVRVLGKNYVVIRAGKYDDMLLQEVDEILEDKAFLNDDGTSLFSS